MTGICNARTIAFALSTIFLTSVATAQTATPPTESNPPSPVQAFILPDGYPTADQVRQKLYQTAEENPDLCQAFDLTEFYGTPATHEGRHLYALRISAGDSPGRDKPAVLFVSAHHGDELATVVTALEGIETLVTGYGTDPIISALLETREVWIAPLWNPDGYSNGTRVNGRRNGNDTVGVDLNRNYPVGYGACGGSDIPGTSTFQGPSAGSEPETQTMLAFAQDRRFVIVHDAHAGAFDLRTGYGCDTFHPWREFMNLQATKIVEETQLDFAQGTSCCLAGNIHMHLASNLAISFLWELGSKSQSAEEAVAQARHVWAGVVPNLAQPMSLSGQVVDASTGDPVRASISLPDAGFTMNESGSTRGDSARFSLILPPGEQTIEFSADGYETTSIQITIESGASLERTIQLVPIDDAPAIADPS